jgi:hypothetical protein
MPRGKYCKSFNTNTMSAIRSEAGGSNWRRGQSACTVIQQLRRDGGSRASSRSKRYMIRKPVDDWALRPGCRI